MRFIVYGAGAIGAIIGGHLQQHGFDVTLIARGEQARALREHGLSLESHAGLAQLRLPVVEHPRELELRESDVVILSMKTQDTASALDALMGCAPPGIAIACAQNGVENERLALRRFARVQGVSVMVPAVFLQPGRVQAFGFPNPGILDVGRYPSGCDALSSQLSAAFGRAGFDSRVQPEILRFKYGKLLFNLSNAIEAVCGPAARKGPIADRVRDEALACLRAAGVDFDADGAAARGQGNAPKPLGSEARPGGSSWQSLMRGTGSIETDYLNGEIVLLGRSAGVATPANALLQRLSNELARGRRPPGEMSQTAFLAELDAAAS